MHAQLNPNVVISGIGSYLPDRVVDNDALSELISGYDTEASGDFGTWVDRVTHVHERRFCDFETRTCDMAYVAAKRAMQVADIGPDDLGMIIYATFTPSHDIPGDHCLLAEALGAHSTPTFNLKAACAGTIYGLGLAWSMVGMGLYDHVLVIGSETISKAINYHDPLTAILFGDGAGAAVVSRRPEGGDGGMLPPHLGFKFSPRNIHLGNSNVPVDVAHFPERQIQPGVPLVEQALVQMEGGPNVLRKAITSMTQCVTRCLGYDDKALRRKDPQLMETLLAARFVPHQANGRIVDGLVDRLRVSRERVVCTLYRFGNISAASNLVGLDFGFRRGNLERKLNEDGTVRQVVEVPEQRFQAGELVLLPSIGGGYLMGCVGFVVDERLAARVEATHADSAAGNGTP